MIKAILYLVGTLAAIIFLLILHAYLTEDPILTCLDRGGCWNYELDECECTYQDRCRLGPRP